MEITTNAREYISFGKKCAIKKKNLAVSMSMLGDDENVDASVGDVVLGGDVEQLEIKYVDGSWADDLVGEIEDNVEDDGLMQSAG